MRVHCCHSTGQIHFDDINLNKEYHPWRSYSQSKLANVLFTRELANRLKGTEAVTIMLYENNNNKENKSKHYLTLRPVLSFVGSGVTTYSLHPGVIRTELGRHLWPTIPLWKRLMYTPLMLLIKSPNEGAQTTIYCAVDESLQNQSGLYYRSVSVNR